MHNPRQRETLPYLGRSNKTIIIKLFDRVNIVHDTREKGKQPLPSKFRACNPSTSGVANCDIEISTDLGSF